MAASRSQSLPWRVVGIAQVENKLAAVGGGERAVDDAFHAVEVIGSQARD